MMRDDCVNGRWSIQNVKSSEAQSLLLKDTSDLAENIIYAVSSREIQPFNSPNPISRQLFHPKVHLPFHEMSGNQIPRYRVDLSEFPVEERMVHLATWCIPESPHSFSSSKSCLTTLRKCIDSSLLMTNPEVCSASFIRT
jgi:hypothetical protein